MKVFALTKGISREDWRTIRTMRTNLIGLEQKLNI